MDKLITIIVPVYNAEKYIGRCIKSLIEQTYYNIEILIINDGSTDSSLEVCSRFSYGDKRVRVIDQPNAGVSNARNTGLAMAKGDFICFVDADDYVDKDFIHHMYDLKEKNNADLVICGFNEIKEDVVINNTFGDIRILLQSEAMEMLLREDEFRGYVWNKLFSKEIIKKTNLSFDEKISVWEDVLFTFKYMCYSKTIIYDPEPKYNYIYIESSSSHKMNHVLNVDKSFSALIAKEQIEKSLPTNYENVRRQLAVRYVKSSLAVVRNIGYLDNLQDNKKYLKECKVYIKNNIKIAYNYLNHKEKILCFLTCCCPKLLMIMYKRHRT